MKLYQVEIKHSFSEIVRIYHIKANNEGDAIGFAMTDEVDNEVDWYKLPNDNSDFRHCFLIKENSCSPQTSN